MSNVTSINGAPVAIATAPNPMIVDILRKLLEHAESGYLQSFMGIGFTHDGLRMTVMGDTEPDACKMLGAIEWLKLDYIRRHPPL